MQAELGPVVLCGPNGAGKTNLLEAISFLTPGRGLRRARLGDVGRRDGRGGWAVAARATGADGPVDIGTGLVGEGEGERRSVRIDGETVSGPAQLAEVCGAVWLTPGMDRLFAGPAGDRRRFLDRLVFGFDPAHARRVSAYERTVRERARLLKTGGDPVWLDALERNIAESGVAIAAARLDLVARLKTALAVATGPFPKADIAVEGLVESWLTEASALVAEDRLLAELKSHRGRDAELGGAGAGPHKSDLVVRHAVKDMPAGQCSTGEQKALLIAVVLADARLQSAHTGRTPLLLLDEVAAHLDAERRASLFDVLLGLGGQAWLTGTDFALFDGLKGRAGYFLVRDGTVAPIEPS